MTAMSALTQKASPVNSCGIRIPGFAGPQAGCRVNEEPFQRIKTENDGVEYPITFSGFCGNKRYPHLKIDVCIYHINQHKHIYTTTITKLKYHIKIKRL